MFLTILGSANVALFTTNKVTIIRIILYVCTESVVPVRNFWEQSNLSGSNETVNKNIMEDVKFSLNLP